MKGGRDMTYPVFIRVNLSMDRRAGHWISAHTHSRHLMQFALLSLPCRLHLPPAQGLCRCCSLCLKALPCLMSPSSHQLLLSPQSLPRVWSEEPASSTMHSRKPGPFCSPHSPVFITSLFAQFCDLSSPYGFKPAHLPYIFNQFFLFGGKMKINCDLTIVLLQSH